MERSNVSMLPGSATIATSLVGWWIGNAIFVAVVVPVVVALLVYLLRPALALRRHAGELARRRDAVASAPARDDELEHTARLVREAAIGLERYATAVDAVIRGRAGR